MGVCVCVWEYLCLCVYVCVARRGWAQSWGGWASQIVVGGTTFGGSCALSQPFKHTPPSLLLSPPLHSSLLFPTACSPSLHLSSPLANSPRWLYLSVGRFEPVVSFRYLFASVCFAFPVFLFLLSFSFLYFVSFQFCVFYLSQRIICLVYSFEHVACFVLRFASVWVCFVGDAVGFPCGRRVDPSVYQRQRPWIAISVLQ